MKKFLLLLPLVFLTAATKTTNTPSPVNIKVELSQAFATLGDQLSLTVTVSHPLDMEILGYEPLNPAHPFQVREVKDLQEMITKNRRKIEGKVYRFTVFEMGEYIFGPIRVNYLDANKKQAWVESDKLYLTVESVIKNDKDRNDIRDIKSVVGIKSRYFFWLVLGTIFLLIFIFWPLVQRFLKKKEAERLAALVTLTADEEAYQALAQLKNSTLPREGKIKEFYVKLSEIIRRYLSRRYLIEVLDLTTYELNQKLKEVEMTQAVRDLTISILKDCDFVKFAKYEPSFNETRQHINQATEMIDKTKIIVIEPVAEEKT